MSPQAADFSRPASPILAPSTSIDLTSIQTAPDQQPVRSDRQPLEAGLARLDGAEASPAVASQRSRLHYALDTLAGIIYLDAKNTRRWSLTNEAGEALSYPLDFSLNYEGVYIIEGGTLYRGDLSDLTVGEGDLSLTTMLTPGSLVDGYPIKEIVAVEATNTGQAVFILDKSNDVYRYDLDRNEWNLEQVSATAYEDPAPLYLNLGSYDNRLYLLDPARNQIWRHPPNLAGAGYLPGSLPWALQPDDPDLNEAIDLAIDGQIYVLWRDGTIVVYEPEEVARFSLAEVAPLSHVPGLAELPSQPAAIFANVEGTALYVADPGQRRVVALDRNDGRLLRQLSAPDNPDFAALRGVVETEDRLLMLAGSHLYIYDLSHGLTTPVSPAGHLPELKPLRPPNLPVTDLLPHDSRLPLLLETYNFTLPLEAARLPGRSSVYPGSRRAYRYGVHQGLDLFGTDVGVEVALGSPVYAAAAGQVLEADLDYQAMSPLEVENLLDEANQGHITPPETLEKLNGRQVWLDHGQGVATRYSHLSDIAPDLQVGQRVEAGQLIGYVGLSGSLDGAEGNIGLAHLHFEIRFGPAHQYYLGQWLTIEATRRAFEQIFKVPVQPAYLERKQAWDSAASDPAIGLEAASPESELDRSDDRPEVGPDSATLTYIVQDGDTLVDIGRRFGLDYETLIAVNDLDRDDYLQIGQELIIPSQSLTSTILGHSTGRRPIEAYQFGDGPVHVVFVGGLHGGYEWNTILLAYRAIDFFAANPEQVPDSVSLYIIPAANPDGQVRITGHDGRFSVDEIEAETEPGRFNNNEVDLNRNWPCDWQPTALWRDQEINAGTAPFSEIETQTLRDFLTAAPPAAVVFWHSALPGVFAGNCHSSYAPAETLAALYAKAADYPLPGTFDSYQVTGAAADWLALQDIPAITVELSNHTDLDWSQNLAGMQAVLGHVR